MCASDSTGAPASTLPTTPAPIHRLVRAWRDRGEQTDGYDRRMPLIPLTLWFYSPVNGDQWGVW